MAAAFQQESGSSGRGGYGDTDDTDELSSLDGCPSPRTGAAGGNRGDSMPTPAGAAPLARAAAGTSARRSQRAKQPTARRSPALAPSSKPMKKAAKGKGTKGKGKGSPMHTMRPWVRHRFLGVGMLACCPLAACVTAGPGPLPGCSSPLAAIVSCGRRRRRRRRR
jgi:hypothetical protein